MYERTKSNRTQFQCRSITVVNKSEAYSLTLWGTFFDTTRRSPRLPTRRPFGVSCEGSWNVGEEGDGGKDRKHLSWKLEMLVEFAPRDCNSVLMWGSCVGWRDSINRSLAAVSLILRSNALCLPAVSPAVVVSRLRVGVTHHAKLQMTRQFEGLRPLHRCLI